MAEKYPGWSPYNYTLQNPVKLVDPDERSVAAPPSTHTDEDGNVVAVYDDGNLGIYQHSQEEIANGNLNNDLDKRVGITLSQNSFSRGDKIKFGSFWARDFINDFELKQYTQVGLLGPIANKLDYALGARNGFKYDPKSNGNFGSQISKGVYISKRDAGNFIAGAFGRIDSYFASRKQQLLAGFGAFAISGNNFENFAKNFGGLYNQALNYNSSRQLQLENPGQRTYGESPISNFFQRLGFENIKTLQ